MQFFEHLRLIGATQDAENVEAEATRYYDMWDGFSSKDTDHDDGHFGWKGAVKKVLNVSVCVVSTSACEHRA